MYIHLFQESEVAYIVQGGFGNSLRLKLSPQLNIISQLMSLFLSMKKHELRFAFPLQNMGLITD